MLALARRVLRDEHEAADVVQDAYLSAWRAFDGFAEESRISTWLHRIVVNAALMRLRTRRRSREEPFDELVDVVSSAADDDSLEGQTGRSQLRAFVRRCVASLPPGHRQVIELRDFEDKDTH
jgi:RNA polymerase sigma-70 factor (ECF subfamily)